MEKMKINWKVRFRNKTWLLGLSGVILTFVYTVLGMFDILPSVTESMVSDIIIAVLNVLAAIGVIIDPTTAGMSDSSQAMNYEKPKEE